MSDAQSQLAEVDALIAASPDEPSLLQLREDLLQLIALEEQEKSNSAAAAAPNEQHSEQQQQQQQIGEPHSKETSEKKQSSSDLYTAQSTFTENSNSLAEAPDLGSFQFQPVVKSTPATATQVNLKSGDDNDESNKPAATTTAAAAAAQPTEKKKKKKKKKEDSTSATFELPNHLIPLDSDTDAQRQKKQRAAKSLKSKFRAKQKEKEQTKRANDWKSFASKTSKKKKALGGKSIFSTEEGVDAKVGVMRGRR
jgi:hypothetical protein